MFKNDFSLQRRIEFMTTYGLTPNEFETMMCVYMAQDHESRIDEEYRTEFNCPAQPAHPESLIALAKIMGVKAIRQILLDLQSKNIILKSCKLPGLDSTEGISPNDIKFNKTVMKNYIKHSGEMFFELFFAFPSHMDVQGKKVSMRSVGGPNGYPNLDEAAFAYGKAIRFDPKIHERIIEIVERATELNVLNMGLLKFIQGQEWLNLNDVLEEGAIGNKNIEVNFE